MISVDAGVWQAFLRKEPAGEGLQALLEEERVTVHPFVLLELQLRLRGGQRAGILMDLARLVACSVLASEAIGSFIADHALGGTDLDLVGVHLLASALENGDQVWSSDAKVRAYAERLELAWDPIRAREAAKGSAALRRKK